MAHPRRRFWVGSGILVLFAQPACSFTNLDDLRAASGSGAGATGAASTSGPGAGGHAGYASTGADGGGPPLDCDGHLVACSGECVDITADVRHCGACGHDCLGAACTEGVCEATTIANDEGLTGAIAADATNVYWVRTGQNGGLVSCPNSGPCASPTVIASDQSYAHDVVLFDDSVYWTNGGAGTILSCPKAGCKGAPIEIADGQPDANALVIDGTHLYWNTGIGGSQTGTVKRCALPACLQIEDIADGLLQPSGLSVSGTQVYWTSIAGVDSIESCTVTNCGTPTLLVSNQSSPYRIAVEGDEMFWVNYELDGGVFRCSSSACPAPEMLTEQASPSDLAMDDKYLYWTSSTTTGAVLRCERPRCANTLVLATASFPIRIAIDEQRLYWTTQYGEVRSVPR